MILGESERLVVLPDSASGVRLAEGSGLSVLCAYTSGRPFVIGSEPVADRLWTFRGHDRSAVLLGCIPSNRSKSVADALLEASNVDCVESLSLPGAFLLVVRIGRVTRVQGTLSGLRRVFWTMVDGEPVAASDESLLARLTGSSVAEETLGRWLLSPYSPNPLASTTPWAGMSSVDPGYYARIESRLVETRRYWSPRKPEANLSQGVDRLRERIVEAVEQRCQSAQRLTCDASGGLDSSSILALAARQRRDVAAFTTGPPDIFADEQQWAELLLDHLGVDQWVRTAPDTFPEVFKGISDASPSFGAPFAGEPVKERSRYIAQHLVSSSPGSSVTHLTGHLGDELFASGTAHLRDLAVRAPNETVRRIRVLNSRTRVPQRALWRWAFGNATYRRSYNELLQRGSMSIGWHSQPIAWPIWTRAHARSVVASIPRVSASVQPLGYTAEQHEALSRVHASSEMLRHETDIMAQFGVYLEVPLGDDRVLDAALRLPRGALHDPFFVKPVLRRALGDLLPDSLMNRTTKVDNTSAIWRGLRAHTPELRNLTREMLAERAGLVDAGVFRGALLGPHPPSLAPMALWRTLAVEAWLRDQAGLRAGVTSDRRNRL